MKSRFVPVTVSGPAGAKYFLGRAVASKLRSAPRVCNEKLTNQVGLPVGEAHCGTGFSPPPAAGPGYCPSHWQLETLKASVVYCRPPLLLRSSGPALARYSGTTVGWEHTAPSELVLLRQFDIAIRLRHQSHLPEFLGLSTLGTSPLLSPVPR